MPRNKAAQITESQFSICAAEASMTESQFNGQHSNSDLETRKESELCLKLENNQKVLLGLKISP